MRQRKVKNESEKLAALEEYMVKDGRERKGQWRKSFTFQNEVKRELYLEIGCGRGHFLTTLANNYPKRCYIGVEGRSSIVLRTLELINNKGLSNVLCIAEFIEDPRDYFEKEELDGIYLNFSDPWPKVRHAKRRLTHRSFLEGYKYILKPGSFLEIKTDNADLFAFTLEELEAVGMDLVERSDDLHRSDLTSRSITTQYEERFLLLNKKIFYCKVKV
ncbi:MAG: tRNA (guanosine(46)-N7)-methyltransferase TrmB [Spirochaetia bacterium]|nr:tRNA (guanosine(46)-N7)-methyltransferase TrmB [Spirochaetia bacterium]